MEKKDVAKWLLAGRSGLYSKDYDIAPALHRAPNKEMAQLLLVHKADVNAKYYKADS